MASRKQQRWIVPGFGLPLQWPQMQVRAFQPLITWDNDTLLGSALDCSENPSFCYTMREIAMIAWMNALTDMPDWHRKVFDPDFTFEWKSAKVLTSYDVTRSMVDWNYRESNGIHDLVDPFQYPYTWERTRTLRQGSVSRTDCILRCGDGGIAKMPPEEDCRQDEFGKYRNDMAWSRRHQWLPFDVRFDDDGRGRARIDGYINNVHPIRNSALYSHAEILIDHLLPLFNRALIDLKAPGYQNQRIHLVRFGRDPFIKREPPAFRPPEQRAYTDWLNLEGQYRSSIFVDLKREFWNIGLQMVLQIREITLTPEHPEFDGDEWHVQGQTVRSMYPHKPRVSPRSDLPTDALKNERICAAASYIYSISNVSPTLSFRRKIFPEEAIAAKGEIRTPPFLPQIYGAKHGDPIIQTLGSVSLKENRVVVWPNVFQMKIDPFGIHDKRKEGYLRILTLHLIDPNRRCMSTAMVPCQRRDWWAEAVRKSCPVLYRLPMEIFKHIIDSIDEEAYPISTAEGERIRANFVREREEFRKKHTEAMEGYEEWDFYGEPGFRDGEGDDDE
ncbi:MAG: hypothetical protein Q9182_005727 [Xanthomendoza sp. 2 TL-2023]